MVLITQYAIFLGSLITTNVITLRETSQSICQSFLVKLLCYMACANSCRVGGNGRAAVAMPYHILDFALPRSFPDIS